MAPIEALAELKAVGRDRRHRRRRQPVGDPRRLRAARRLRRLPAGRSLHAARPERAAGAAAAVRRAGHLHHRRRRLQQRHPLASRPWLDRRRQQRRRRHRDLEGQRHLQLRAGGAGDHRSCRRPEGRLRSPRRAADGRRHPVPHAPSGRGHGADRSAPPGARGGQQRDAALPHPRPAVGRAEGRAAAARRRRPHPAEPTPGLQEERR